MNELVRPAALAAGVLATVALTACGTTKLEGPEVAQRMKVEALAPLGLSGATVRCPAETEAKAGAIVQCSVTAEGKKGTVTAKVQNKEGTLADYKASVSRIQLARIEDEIEQQEPTISGVACPSNVKPAEGESFTCFGTIRGSGLGRVQVTQTSEDGDVRVRVVRRKLTTGSFVKKLEKQVEKAVPGINAQVNCPKNVESRKGQVIACTVTNPANGRSVTLRYRQTTSEADSFKQVK